MDAPLAPHAALFDCTVIDLLRAAYTHRLTRCVAQEEPRTVMAGFALTPCPPVVLQLLPADGYSTARRAPCRPCHGVLAIASGLDQYRWFSDPLLPRRVARKRRRSSRTPGRAAGSAHPRSLPTRCARRSPRAG